MAGGMPLLKEQDFKPLPSMRELALEAPFAEGPIRAALRRVASRHPGGKVLINLERAK